MKRELIEQGALLIIKGLEAELDHNFKDTPRRMADVYEELFTPKKLDHNVVFDEEYTDIVVIRNYEFWTMCPHHLLPVLCSASIAYEPKGKVLGASKLMRLIADVNTRPKTQERLTADILDRLNTLTESTALGGGIQIIGRHGCFSMRGVKTRTADMKTLKFAGSWKDDLRKEQRFLEMIR